MRSTKWHFTYLLTYLIFSLLLSSYRGWVCFSTLPVVRYKPWPKGTAFLSFASKTGFSAKSRLICLKFDHGRRPRRGAGGGTGSPKIWSGEDIDISVDRIESFIADTIRTIRYTDTLIARIVQTPLYFSLVTEIWWFSIHGLVISLVFRVYRAGVNGTQGSPGFDVTKPRTPGNISNIVSEQ